MLTLLLFQADNRDISSAREEHMPYLRFTKVIIMHFISKDKTISMRNRINLHTVRDDTLLDIKDSKAYKTYLDFATGKATPKKARKFKKVASPSKKLSLVLEEEPVVKPTRAKKPAKKSTTIPTADVVIRDTPGVSMSKKKAPTKANRGKYMDLLSEAALLEVAQLKKTLKKSKLETRKLHASGSGDGVGSQPKVPDESEDKTTGTDEGTGTILGVPDVPKYQSESENESWGDSDDDSNDDDNDDASNDDGDVDSDVDGDNEASETEKRLYGFTNDDEEYKELYKDVNVRLKATEQEEEGKGDAEMTDKTEVLVQSSISSDFANQFLNLDNVPPTNSEVVSMMNVKVRHEEPSTQNPSLLNIPVRVIPKTSTATGPTIPPTISPITPLPQQSTPTPTPAPTTETTTTTIPALLDFSSLFGFDQRVFALEKELCQIKQADHSAQLLTTIKSQIPAMVDAQLSTRLEDSIKKASDRKDKDKDEDPLAGSDQELKKRKTSKDAKPSTGSKSKESKSKGTKSNPKSSVKSTQAEESVFETADTKMPQNQGSDLGNTEDQPNVEATSKSDWFKKHERPLTLDPDWNTNKSIDFRPPQTWISKIAKAGKPPPTFNELMSTPIDFSAYVINNIKINNLTQEHLVGLAFNLLKGTCKSRVELEYHFEEYQGRQVVPVNYFINNDLEYLKGESLSRKYTTSTTKTKVAKYDDIQGIEDIHRYVVQVSNHDVFSTKRIIAVTHVKVMKWYDYGYLEEIEVRREDQQHYKFREGDFPKLNLSDIEDMFLLLVLKKLSNLERDVIFDLNVALQMFNHTCYSFYRWKSSTCLRMDYLPKRRWSKLDRKRSRIMIKAINQQLFERRLTRNLEKFVGGRDYEEDFKLLERTI
ncbi:hypothetical protein Tco_0786154 [Tanacetum coccineum]